MSKRFPAPAATVTQGRPENQFNQFEYNSVALSSPDSEALRLVKFEKTQWETAFAYVTEKVAFNMRDVIRQCRKNYWGVFDSPTDPTTGRDKVWEHLTKTFVDYVVAAYDLDTKDINFRARHPDAIALTSVVRSIVKNGLDEANFGEQLDLSLRQLGIDGTIVWCTPESDNDILGPATNPTDGLKIRLVDLLNFYIDPTVDSIAQADSVIERIVVTKDEFDRLAEDNAWMNKNLEGKRQVSRYDTINNPGYNTNSDITYVELYRRRGLAPEYIINGGSSRKLIPTEIICSGTNGNWLFHFAKKRKSNAKKGYEEGWLTRVHGRWYGEGVAERLIQKQIHHNIISNIRINRSYLSQLGIFLVRKGSGITPQQLSRLAANGALSVTNIDTDIKQLQMDESSEASYKDEEILYQWAQRYTGATDVINGESLPASTPATNAAIQSQAAKSRFTLVKEGIGMFLQRWLKSQAMPVIFSKVKAGDLVRMHLDSEQLQAFDDGLVNKELAKALDDAKANNLIIDPQMIELERQRLQQHLQSRGSHRFILLEELPDILKYDVAPYITNEEFDKAVIMSNIQQLLQVMAAIPGMDPSNIMELVRESLDIMGLDATRFKLTAPPPQPPPGQQPQQGGQNQQSQTNSTGITPGQPNVSPRTRSQNLIQTLAPSLTQEPQAK